MLTVEELSRLLADGENANVECKLADGGLPRSLWESYSAFANTDGGTIILGVSDKNRAPVGVKNADKLIADFWNTINNSEKVSFNILFNRHVYAVDYHGKNLLVIEVPRAERTERPVTVGQNVFRGTFRRNGEGDYRCSKDSVTAMIRDSGDVTADNTLYPELTIADLNADTIARYRGRFANQKKDHIWNRLPDEEFLLKIGAARRGDDHIPHPNLAGLVCFGDFVTIINFLPHYFVDYRERLSGETRWSDRVCAQDATWSGNIYDFFFRIHDRLTADIKVPFAMSDSVTRIDDTPMHKALRELLANALIHADYHGRCGIVIEKEFRSLSFINPGLFRINKQTAIAGGVSDARNEHIFNIFALVDIGERSGSGLCNLFGLCEQYGFPAPQVSEDYSLERITTVVTLPVMGDIKDNGGSSKEISGSSKEIGGSRKKIGGSSKKISGSRKKISGSRKEISGAGKIFGGARKKISSARKDIPNENSEVARGRCRDNDQAGIALRQEILTELRRSPAITIPDLAVKLARSPRKISKHLKILQETQKIRRVGGRKNGFWEVIG